MNKTTNQQIMSSPRTTEGLFPWPRVWIPPSLEGQELVVGVDEAGRGPVIGPLIYTIAFWPKSEDDSIGRLGFNDSKQLTATERDNLLKKIINHPSIGWVIEEIDSITISEVK
jgi:ribonuclease H2 subunit A